NLAFHAFQQQAPVFGRGDELVPARDLDLHLALRTGGALIGLLFLVRAVPATGQALLPGLLLGLVERVDGVADPLRGYPLRAFGLHRLTLLQVVAGLVHPLAGVLERVLHSLRADRELAADLLGVLRNLLQSVAELSLAVLQGTGLLEDLRIDLALP